jgi:hypothetical protein
MSPGDLLVSSLTPAQTLQESAIRLDPMPLGPTDPRYVPLDLGRDTGELRELETILRNAARTPNAFAKCAFIGARGSGKSTYLLHLEAELQQERLFTPVHIYLDPSLESDCDYADLFLWIADQIARQFQAAGHPLSDALLSRFAEWYAEKSFSDSSEWKKEIGLTTEAEAGSKTGLPGIFSLKLLARLKSMIVGSETSRREIRKRVQNYATELRGLMDDLLDHAREVLRDAGEPTRLLIVQDNLDRISPSEKARHLFEFGGDMLVNIRADIVFTAPVAMKLASFDVGRVFPHVVTMPNVKVRLRDGSIHQPGIDSLTRLIERRLSSLVFEDASVARFLAEKSGGSVRDLIRLLDSAQLKAQVAGKERVDQASAEEAVRKLGLHRARLLIPESVYHPILVQIARTKAPFALAGDATASPETVKAAREFFAELIGNGTVLEYNGNDSWYDVHPALLGVDSFQHALATDSAPKKAAKPAARRPRSGKSRK